MRPLVENANNNTLIINVPRPCHHLNPGNLTKVITEVTTIRKAKVKYEI